MGITHEEPKPVPGERLAIRARIDAARVVGVGSAALRRVANVIAMGGSFACRHLGHARIRLGPPRLDSNAVLATVGRSEPSEPSGFAPAPTGTATKADDSTTQEQH